MLKKVVTVGQCMVMWVLKTAYKYIVLYWLRSFKLLDSFSLCIWPCWQHLSGSWDCWLNYFLFSSPKWNHLFMTSFLMDVILFSSCIYWYVSTACPEDHLHKCFPIPGLPLTWKVRENLEKWSGKVRERFLFLPKFRKLFFSNGDCHENKK